MEAWLCGGTELFADIQHKCKDAFYNFNYRPEGEAMHMTTRLYMGEGDEGHTFSATCSHTKPTLFAILPSSTPSHDANNNFTLFVDGELDQFMSKVSMGTFKCRQTITFRLQILRDPRGRDCFFTGSVMVGNDLIGFLIVSIFGAGNDEYNGNVSFSLEDILGYSLFGLFSKVHTDDRALSSQQELLNYFAKLSTNLLTKSIVRPS